MSRMRPYLNFALCFVVISLPLSYLSSLPETELLRTTLVTLSTVVAAAIGVLVAQRAGRLSIGGLLVVGVIMSSIIYLATWGSYQWLALQQGGSVPFWRLAQVGGWPYILSVALYAVAPAVCRWLLPNNSFKPTPLRGAA